MESTSSQVSWSDMVLELDLYSTGEVTDISLRGFLQDSWRELLLVKTGVERSSFKRNTGSDLLKIELEEMGEVLDVQL